MGRDTELAAEIMDGTVSIHAPAWGATEAVQRVAVMSDVSIHAPAWGAT